MSVISYPIPAYANVPIEPQYYTPRRRVISAISLGNTTTVTTTEENAYVEGQQIRLIIPSGYGCRELNEVQGTIITINSITQFVLDINSLGFNAFIAASLPTQAQTIPVGEFSNGTTNSTGRMGYITYIPGSFRNISPQ